VAYQLWSINGVIDINLKQNPNLEGMLVRTLRILLERGDALGPALADYLQQGLMRQPPCVQLSTHERIGEFEDEFCEISLAARIRLREHAKKMRLDSCRRNP